MIIAILSVLASLLIPIAFLIALVRDKESSSITIATCSVLIISSGFLFMVVAVLLAFQGATGPSLQFELGTCAILDATITALAFRRFQKYGVPRYAKILGAFAAIILLLAGLLGSTCSYLISNGTL